MNENKLLIVIPTWERCQAIERLLSEEVEVLSEFKIDICIYDSSRGDETFKLVCEYIKKHKNVLYERVDDAIPSNVKYFDICRKISDSKYKYLWIIQDHLIIKREAIQHIINALDTCADFYYLDMFSNMYNQKVENDLNSFAIKSAWMLTRYGTAVFKIDSFLKGIEWDGKIDKWLNDKTINFSHVGLIFERLIEMNNAKVESVSFKREQFYDFMRFQPVAWDGELLRICLECWGMTIEKLPNTYRKEQIMQSQDALFISNIKLLSLKSEHRYGVNEYERFKEWICKIYPERDKEFKDIAYLPGEIAEKRYFGKIFDAINKAREKQAPVYVYGAGRHGTELASYLDKKKILFNGLLVSTKEGNPNCINDHYVYEASEKIRNGNALIIIAVAKGSVDLISKMIDDISDNPNDVLILDEII
ncbi:MAG: hypothetical protein J6X94_00575 [Lachnospiraceae bacterium]|nr:hypothetical protein [Lachnospiraceae bacterium]